MMLPATWLGYSARSRTALDSRLTIDSAYGYH
jgi:hypothetical protein